MIVHANYRRRRKLWMIRVMLITYANAASCLRDSRLEPKDTTRVDAEERTWIITS